MNNPWNLDDGLKLIRAMQPDTRRYGYHLTLGGSVLNQGESRKDLDLYFLPLNNPRIAEEDPTGLIDWLVKMWGNFEVIGKDYGNDANLNYDIETPQTNSPFIGQITRSDLPVWRTSSGQSRASVPVVRTPAPFQDYATNPAPTPAYPPPARGYNGAEVTRSPTTWYDDLANSLQSNDQLIEESIFQSTVRSIAPDPLTNGSYKYKLKFNRNRDRIDVFIL
jgi:hypothetical protein